MFEITKALAFLLLLHGECRGEPLSGQIAVSNVVFNRGIDSNTINYKQFNCFNNKQLNCAILNNNLTIVSKAVIDNLTIKQMLLYSIIYTNKNLIKLFSDDSIYYYMTPKAYNIIKKKYKKWSLKLKIKKQIGNHIFLYEK